MDESNGFLDGFGVGLINELLFNSRLKIVIISGWPVRQPAGRRIINLET